MSGEAIGAAPGPGAASASAVIGKPALRWSSRARTISEIESELAKIWSSISLTTPGEDGGPERRVAARSSVMSLVVVAGPSVRHRQRAERRRAPLRCRHGASECLDRIVEARGLEQ